MLSRWSIRNKLLFGTAWLGLVVAILAINSLHGVYAYRDLVRGISQRAAELEPASRLTSAVGELRFSLRQIHPVHEFSGSYTNQAGLMREQFSMNLFAVRGALDRYDQALRSGELEDPYIGDKRREWETVQEIRQCMNRISSLRDTTDWVLEPVVNSELDDEVERLVLLTGKLPVYLQEKMRDFRDHVRGQYRTWIILAWTAALLTLGIMLGLSRLFYLWVFRPLRVLIAGARCVVAGDFAHRIQLPTHDEIAALADAMNAMTGRFQQVRDDLDAQVQQRTKEVVRSEQLASVGFLAAGVAHEINNPLASIAWSAESLESRLHEILHGDTPPDADQEQEIKLLKTYLRRIQDEAFRCKGITERLLDFSRLGDIQRQDTDLRELVQLVIDMVQHLGKHRDKKIEFQCDQHVIVPVNAQEIKQVVLNLITNALDSLDSHGTVLVSLCRSQGQAVLTVRDNGVGMTPEVLTHLFEPFFTRRRDGQGTGLGLSITYRIVTDHGGQILAASDGPGQGSQLTVRLPLSCHEEENQRRLQAA